MFVRLAFIAELGSDDNSFEIAASFGVGRVPTIGECVILPDELCKLIAEKRPSQFVDRRFRVCAIDLHWDKTNASDVSVYVESIVKR